MDKYLFWSDRGEGKTTLLTKISNDLSNSGFKITYISGTEETPPLNREVNHIYDGRNINYTLSIIKEKSKLGMIDFLIVDDIDMFGFGSSSNWNTINVIYEMSCNIICSISHYDEVTRGNTVIPQLVADTNIIKIRYDKGSPLLTQTFNKNNSIKYKDIINTYLRDKKIDQIL